MQPVIEAAAGAGGSDYCCRLGRGHIAGGRGERGDEYLVDVVVMVGRRERTCLDILYRAPFALQTAFVESNTLVRG